MNDPKSATPFTQFRTYRLSQERSLRRGQRRRSALTLIEVLAGILLLSTLLVGILVAQERHAKQISHARTKIEACRAANDLLTQWYTSEQPIPLEGEGNLPNDAAFHWRTESRPFPDLELIGIEIVRLTIEPQQAVVDSKPLAIVDLVVRNVDQSQQSSESGVLDVPNDENR